MKKTSFYLGIKHIDFDNYPYLIVDVMVEGTKNYISGFFEMRESETYSGR